MNYQELFKCLKGVGEINLSSLALPVAETGFALYPMNCAPDAIDVENVNMLTMARNRNIDSFLTYFKATPERTKRWLAESVATDNTRILFALREIGSGVPYGYMGLAYGDEAGTRIEGDAIVRYSENIRPGLMREAFLRLIAWVKRDLGVKEVWVRVRSGNQAVRFYEKCGFVTELETPLYEVFGSSGELVELSVVKYSEVFKKSSEMLVHMRFSRAV